ncbi:methyltransferase [Streptomyces diastatochromogenes]|uniref:Methyltransferase n=2 Tax=Streptomyces diastatochromogenes TaxID=42236 RepID=A0A233RZE3_STRDA|nr:methyltransferase [Streptomyces diastatochromogenes]
MRQGDLQVMNADVPWHLFDPIAYVEHNYRDMWAEDAEILRIVRDHFVGHFRNRDVGRITGIDVGAGANLYPALSMLPWCDEITLLEHSSANVRYLESQVDSYDTNWDQFWNALCEHETYGSLGLDPRDRFRRVVKVRQGSIFDLSRHEGQWSVGTMFFVAESMTDLYEEFTWGVERFMRTLAPGAPFAAAFMAHSKGLQVDGHSFPACDVGESEVRASLEPFVHDFKVQRLQDAACVRDGYAGMILAHGWRRNAEAGNPAV